jgi:hypothetical protein
MKIRSQSIWEWSDWEDPSGAVLFNDPGSGPCPEGDEPCICSVKRHVPALSPPGGVDHLSMYHSMKPCSACIVDEKVSRERLRGKKRPARYQSRKSVERTPQPKCASLIRFTISKGSRYAQGLVDERLMHAWKVFPSFFLGG